MPLEIRELVIKAVVGNESPTQGTAGNAVESSNSNQAEIIQQCAEIVLEILKERSER